MVIPAIYGSRSNFFGGYAEVVHPEHGWGFIDREGNFTAGERPIIDIVDCGFVLYPINYNELNGFTDEDGNIIVPIEFNEVRYFSEGLAWVRQGRWWGIIEIVE